MLLTQLLSPYVIDHVLGLHVLTYPRIDSCINASIDRPHGFQVVEIVNGVPVTDLALSDNHCDESKRYLVYLVRKVSASTIDVARDIMRTMRCSDVFYLGLKEANAIAYQLMIASHCRRPKQLLKRRWGSSSLITCYSERPYFQHNGNLFRIVLRSDNPHALESRIRKVSRGSSIPILNFFGYQRFGTTRPITHLLGAALLRNDTHTALAILCEESIAWSRPPKRGYERTICKERNLRRLDPKLRRLFLQAYQSYLFNKALSLTWIQIIKDFGEPSQSIDYLRSKSCPLLAHSANLSDTWEPFASAYRTVLSIEGLDLKDFKTPPASLYLKSEQRRCVALATLRNVTTTSTSVILEVELPRGAYVTVLLRELCLCSIERVL